VNALMKKFSAVGLATALLLGFSFIASRQARAALDLPQTDQAGAALQEGRRLLKRGKSDQALSQLQKALNLYTTAKNNHGIAATENEFGDLYLRQGEYNVALDHYKHAL
jgi:tetratricopeptide (TPR) repeat protein